MIKKIILLFTNPLGLLREIRKSKRKGLKKYNAPDKIKKLLVYSVVGISSTSILGIFFGGELERVKLNLSNIGNTTSIKAIEGTSESTSYPANADGSNNGLNTLLINNLPTTSYARDILSLYLDGEQGKINDSPYHLSVSNYIGKQTNETGTYDGVGLLRSYLPFEDDKVFYKISAQGVPAETMTVRNLDPDNAFNFDKIYFGGGISPGGTGYYGLFQNNNLNNNGGPVSKLNYVGASSGRQSMTFYLPDTIAYLDNRLSSTLANYYSTGNNADGSLILDEYIANNTDGVHGIIITGAHNIGEGGFLYPLVQGRPHTDEGGMGTSEDITKATIALSKDFKNGLVKSDNVLKHAVTSNTSRTVGVYLLTLEGWKLSQEGYDYMANIVKPDDNIASILMGEGKKSSDLMSYFQSCIGGLKGISDADAKKLYSWENANTPWSMYNVFGFSKGFIFKQYSDIQVLDRINNVQKTLVSTLAIETLGQMYSTTHGGDYYYAYALKFGGLDVNPSDPSTYYSQFENEWIPSGDNGWLEDLGVNTRELNAKRLGTLNEAYKFNGAQYVGTRPYQVPKKGSDGNWIYDGVTGFDCSSLIDYVTRTILNKEIGTWTESQVHGNGVEKINPSEAKAGDLVFYFHSDGVCGHVAYFLAPGSTQYNPKIFHAADPSLNIRLSLAWDYRDTYDYIEYYRIKGIDS